MVEVQDKPAGIISHLGGDRRGSGSVPAVRPPLLPSRAMPNAATLSPTLSSGFSPTFYDEIASLLLIVVVPTAFWCGIIVAIRSLIGLETGGAGLSCVGLAIAGFLLIIRASLMIDRSVKPD
jgi:hypothetical protein